MGAIKLKHTSGNGTILNSPAANPSSDITLKLPSTTGSAGQVLSVASANHSSTNAELEFVAAGGGKVLKYETTAYNTQVSHSGTSYVDTGLSRTIQPSAASSKILVLLSQFFNVNVANPNVGASVQLLEGSNVVVPSDAWDIYFFPGVSGNASKNYNHRFNVIMIHTPSYSVGDTLTYKTQMKALLDGNQTNVKAQSSDSYSYLTLVELAA
jgi:hypothetical protein